jgi:Family of unknown function (DUF6174)
VLVSGTFLIQEAAMSQQTPRTRRRRIFALVMMNLVCGLGLASWLIWPETSWARTQEMHAAERRWASRQFGNYHLHIADKRCPQQIEVRNERVVKVAPNRCDAPPRTISDLFTLIRRDGTIAQECIFRGCICDDIIRVNAVYDDSLGYPSRILVRMTAEANWRHPEFWQKAWQTKRLPSCDAMMEGSKIIQVLEIKPRQ